MRASIIAGLVGVVLLLVLLIVFYRRLTLLIAAGMIVWGMLIYSVAVLISQTTNYALTLAGVTGIIVSIGMTVDSYVVYFERMKDEVLHGRTFKNSAARSFKSTWRTILAANLVSFIAAAVLFVPQRRLGPRLRPLPRRDDGVRRDRVVVLHPPGGDPGSRHRPPRPPRSVRVGTGTVMTFTAFPGHTTCSLRSRWPLPRWRSVARPVTWSTDEHNRHRRCRPAARPPGRHTRWRRLVLAQTAIDFWGKRRVWMAISLTLLVISGLSLWQRGLKLGIDFEGGVAWDVPAGDFTIDDARAILDDNGIEREHQRQDPGAQLRQRRHHQGPGRGPARGRPRPAAGGVRRGGRRRRRRGQRQPR